jgi:beta-lactamase superfamily II metal-dependent hydrolase
MVKPSTLWACAHALAILVFANLWSTTASTAPPACGDGQRKGGEQCDGSDLAGATCGSLGYGGGTLACSSSCTYDTTACGSAGIAVCGDGLVEGAEECDVGTDAACPGQCSTECACPGTTPGVLEVHVIDVGQGDAILVVSPDGFTMLFDAGEATEYPTVQAYLAAMGVTGLDYTAVSHMHADHIGGMDLVLADHPEVVSSFDHGGAYESTQFTQYDAAAGNRRVTLQAGQSIDMGPSIQVDVLHAWASSSNENNNSLVLRLTYGTQAVLLGGDCESSCEGSFNPGPIEVYKVHHHGSSDASTNALLDLMSPSAAVISVGDGNAFGHPDPLALDRLANHGVTVYRTDLDGDVVIRSDGSSIAINAPLACSTGATRACGQTDVGTCSLGQQDCVDGGWGTCVGAVGPTPESCGNGLDDDCDGLVDVDDESCGGGGLVIAQVGYDTPGDDTVEEFVDLFNSSGGPMLLDGWSLADNTGSWPLPSGIVVVAGGYVSIARDAAGFESLYGVSADASGMTLSLANGGDRVILVEPGGEVDRVAWGGYDAGWTITAPTGASIERIDPLVDTDGVADWGVTAPAAPRGGTVLGPGPGCGNASCEAGEDCLSCPADCGGVQGGKPATRWCCGNGSCETIGENAGTCPIDCGA